MGYHTLLSFYAGTLTCVQFLCRFEAVGKEGYHSLYRWYQAFEAEHFPDPKGLRDTVARWTLHLYPGCIRAVMAVFDVPEAIAVSRTAMCVGSKAVELTRLQVSMICGREVPGSVLRGVHL